MKPRYHTNLRRNEHFFRFSFRLTFKSLSSTNHKCSMCFSNTQEYHQCTQNRISFCNNCWNVDSALHKSKGIQVNSNKPHLSSHWLLDLPISSRKIQSREIFSLSNGIEDVLYSRKGVHIFFRNGI